MGGRRARALSGAVLDAGALIAFERGDRSMVVLVARAAEIGGTLVVPAAALAQVWRDGRRQARLGRLLATRLCEVVPLDALAARLAGQLCGVAGTADVVDASVVVEARRGGHRVVTSDPRDLARLDPTLELVVV